MTIHRWDFSFNNNSKTHRQPSKQSSIFTIASCSICGAVWPQNLESNVSIFVNKAVYTAEKESQKHLLHASLNHSRYRNRECTIVQPSRKLFHNGWQVSLALLSVPLFETLNKLSAHLPLELRTRKHLHKNEVVP